MLQAKNLLVPLVTSSWFYAAVKSSLMNNSPPLRAASIFSMRGNGYFTSSTYLLIETYGAKRGHQYYTKLRIIAEDGNKRMLYQLIQKLGTFVEFVESYTGYIHALLIGSVQEGSSSGVASFLHRIGRAAPRLTHGYVVVLALCYAVTSHIY